MSKSNIVELVENFKRVQADMMAKLKADGETELKVVFKDIFDKNPGLKAFAYVGWTPGFNDGDPCTHRGMSYVGDFELKTSSWRAEPYWNADCVDESGWEELESHFLNEGADLDDIDTPLDFVNKNCKTIDQASVAVHSLEDIIELVYDTDYLIKVSLDDSGEVVVDHDYYDCGY